MMPFENPVKRRRLVKRLDFENCVVTAGSKGKSGGKRKLRARITREVNNVVEAGSPERKLEDLLPVRFPADEDLASPATGIRSTSGLGESSPEVPGTVPEGIESPAFRCKARRTSPPFGKWNFRSKRKIVFDGEVQKSGLEVWEFAGEVQKSTKEVGKCTGEISKFEGEVPKFVGDVQKSAIEVRGFAGEVQKSGKDQIFQMSPDSAKEIQKCTGEVWKSVGEVQKSAEVRKPEEDVQKSPVFKVNPRKSHKNCISARSPTIAEENEIFIESNSENEKTHSVGSYPFGPEIVSSVETISGPKGNSFRIEEFDVSSVESGDDLSVASTVEIRTGNDGGGSGNGEESNGGNADVTSGFLPPRNFSRPEEREKCGGGCGGGKRIGFESSRKKFKRKGLLQRLRIIVQKQASEKLIWQHQRNLGKSDSETVFLIERWNSDTVQFLKCRCLPPEEEEIRYLVVDSRWVPGIEDTEEGSLIQISPPWQKLCLDKPETNVLLNSFCLEVLKEAPKKFLPPSSSSSPFQRQKVKFQSVFPSPDEDDDEEVDGIEKKDVGF